MNIHAPAATSRLEALFAVQAAATPDAPAVIHRGAVLTYGDLEAWVSRLSEAFVREGVRPGVLVGLSLRRTPGLIAVLLAILRAGGAYLPLDARNPPDRTRFMLEDSGCAVLLVDDASEAASAFPGKVLEFVGGDLVRRASAAAPPASLPPRPRLRHLHFRIDRPP